MISVVIPTFNNKEQLLQNLKKNAIFCGINELNKTAGVASEVTLREADFPPAAGRASQERRDHERKNLPHIKEIIVVNDNPNINLQPDLKKYSTLRLIQNKKNLGFSGAADRGIREAESSHILLLNDDVTITDNTYQNALDYFKDESTFAVSFTQKEKDEALVGKNKLYWASGMLFHSKAKDINKGINAWAEGGAALIDKKKYEILGGLDQLYNPFYWEDIDLSYQAWKQGYKVMFDPDIVVVHHHESTISSNFSNQFIKTIAYRNQFIFIWKNIYDLPFILKHILFLPYHLLYYMLKGELGFVIGFLEALKKIGAILNKRSLSNRQRVLSDREILKLFT